MDQKGLYVSVNPYMFMDQKGLCVLVNPHDVYGLEGVMCISKST